MIKNCPIDRLTPLHWAARNGHFNVAKCLVKNRARVDAKHFYTLMTPLHFASQNGHQDIVELLLHPSNVTTKSDIGTLSQDIVSQNRRKLRREALRLRARIPVRFQNVNHDMEYFIQKI